MTPTFRLLALNLLALACASPLAADLKFTSLGKLTGGTYAYVRGFSADGTTVVGYGQTTGDSQQAFRGNLAGLVSLGDLPGGPATPDSKANAVTSDGSVVVGFGTTAQSQEAFRWTSATGLVSLGRLPGSTNGSEALGVSSDGSVVVGVGYNASFFPEAFRWTAATGIQSIGFLPGCNQSTATGVSADGSVIVGHSSGSGIQQKAFRWTQAGGMVELGALPPGYVTSFANAISADGLVVVGQIATATQGDGSRNREAFRWTQAGGYVSLGDLPGLDVWSEALAVSADGSVIVGSGVGNTYDDRTFIWDATNGLRNLRTVLTAAGKASGWTINATGISANGKMVAGHGTTSSGQTEAWILDLDAPPPPAPTVALVWTEELPQTVAFKTNSVVRLGYDNGVVAEDIVTQTEASGGLDGVEYAEGLLLVANRGSGGTRVHAARYAPIIVSNLIAYDLHATPGHLWQATGGINRLYKLAQSGGFTTSGTVIDRTFTTLINRSVGRFTNAVHSDGTTTFFSSTTNAAGLYKRSAETLFDQATIHTTGSPAVYDFEVVGDQIYFTDINANTIQRIKTDGTGLVTLVSNAMFANGIDVTDTHIYWSELNTGLIRRSNLDGTNPVTLVEGRTALRGVAVLPLSLITGPAPQGLAFNDLPSTYESAINTPVPLSLASTSGLPVSLEIVSGPATVSGNSITYTGAGIVVVRATQAGNASYAPASLTSSVTVRLSQTINFPQPANVTYSGAPVVFPLSATSSSGLQVLLYVASGPATLVFDYATGIATITATGTGSITIRATQGGNATYAPAAFVDRTFTSAAPGADTLADFLTAAGVPANLRGPNDDADNDNLDNLLEYALDLNPNGSGGAFTGTPPALSSTPTLLQLTYRRVRNDVTYTVETSPTMAGASWTAIGVTQGTPAPLPDGTTTASIPLGAGSDFLRLKVTRNQ